MKKAVCLLSGGLDSTTVAYYAAGQGYQLTALTIFYGQLHKTELEYAASTAKDLHLRHYAIPLSLPWGGSALLDHKIAVPLDRSGESMAEKIPSTYVPARNSIFITLAASCAEACGADTIFIGANALDYSGYPDCRPAFFESMVKSLNLGTKAGIEGRGLRIETPLVNMSKKEIILLGRELGVPFQKTWSCYQGGTQPCGRCDACLLRAKGFREAGIKDPLLQS